MAIAFVGSDLAYTDGRPYARGVTFEEDWYGQERWGTSFIRQWKLAINHQPEVVEQDVLSAAPVRTAPHLVSFRNWIVDRTRLEQGRTFINATGAGTLRAEHITQVAPEALPDLLTAPAGPVGDPVRRRLQPGTVERLVGQARALLDGAAAGDAAANALLTRWMQFAPGLTRDALLQALEAGVTAGVSKPEPDSRVGSTVLTAAHAESTEMDWLRLLAWHVPRTAMTLPKDRLLTNPEGVAVFRFRTAAARVMCAAIPLPEDALAENGTPLRRAWDLAAVDPGSYAWFRDEIRFRTSDGSDPRWNDHHYSLLVPTAVAHLEGLPLTEILDQRL